MFNCLLHLKSKPKNMKKKQLLFLGSLLLSLSFYSQLSLIIENKYGFKMPGSYDQLGSYGNSTSSLNANTYELKKYCFGNGYQGSIGFRYGFKNHFGIDFGYSYLLGQKSKTTSSSSSSYGGSGTNEIKARFSKYFIGMSYLNKQKLSPTLKAGMFLSHGKIISENYSTWTNTTYSYNPNPPYNSYTITTTTTEESEYQLTKGLSFGFYAALGISYPVNENITFALNVDAVFHDYSPNKGTLTKYKENGVDKLGTLTINEKETEYKKEYTYFNNSTPAPGLPDVQPKFSVPLSSFGPSFTIYINLGKKKESNLPTESVAK